ncbi:hypothetical protein ACFTSF_37665 [Kribbella sp. NPDC056951]|uniref:hypothetical protein n=1 Tax=Kribbella sp. NPDC056951 TaxID=3345978 RepID=UPI0036349294
MKSPSEGHNSFPTFEPAGWGTSAGNTVAHGVHVVDDLISGIDNHRETATGRYWSRVSPRPAAIGCVPWLTHNGVSQALARLGSCCIVVDKQQPTYRAVQLLSDTATPLASGYLEGFEELALPDENGAGPLIHPYSGSLESVMLGPVRIAGWQGKGQPLLHSKLLVLGVTTYHEDDETFSGDMLQFTPTRTWMGSANWTYASVQHVEFGLWSTDPKLVQRNYTYLLRLLQFSETQGSKAPGPQPELVPASWDDEAFREYFAEHRFDADEEE